MNNRKARLLLGVPAQKVGDVSYYNISNTRRHGIIGFIEWEFKHKSKRKNNKVACND